MTEATVATAQSSEQATESLRAARGMSRVADAGALPTTYLALTGVVTLIGLLLRLPSFNDSLSGDEISTFYIVNGHSLERVLSLVYSGQESTPPLYFVIAWATKGWLGSGHMAQSIRLVSLVTGTAAIPLTFVLGLWTVGRRASLVGATCVALSPFMIFFSSEARTYMLVLFLGLVSSICLLRALDTNRLAWWAGYAVSTCAAVYSHYSVVFFLVAQFAWAFFAAPQARKPVILSNVAAIVGFLPGVAGLPAGFRAPNFIEALLPVDLHNIVSVLKNFWIGHPVIPIDRMPGNVVLLMGAAGLVLGVFGTALARRHRRRRWWRISPGVLMIAVLALTPTVLMIIYSWLRVDVLGGGNIIASWPAMALAVGALVTAPPKPLRIAAVTLVVTAYAIGGVGLLRNTWQRGNVAAALAYIDRTGKGGDPIVSLPLFANPLSEVDAALAGTSSYTYIPGNTLDRARPPDSGDPHPVIRLSAPPFQVPPLDEQFKYLAGPRPKPVFFDFPAPTPMQVAREAMSQAPNGTVFMVTPFPVDPAFWLTRAPDSRPSQFLKTMLTRFHIAGQAWFPSFSLFAGGEYVTVFRKDA